MIQYHAHLAECGGHSYSRLFTASLLTHAKEKVSEASGGVGSGWGLRGKRARNLRWPPVLSQFYPCIQQRNKNARTKIDGFEQCIITRTLSSILRRQFRFVWSRQNHDEPWLHQTRPICHRNVLKRYDYAITSK